MELLTVTGLAHEDAAADFLTFVPTLFKVSAQVTQTLKAKQTLRPPVPSS